MLYIPVLQEQIEGVGTETYWLLLKYLGTEGYFTVADYGEMAGPVTGQVASLQVEDDTWRIYIPACDVEWDPAHPYWLTLEADFTSRPVRVDVVDYGLAQ